MSSDNISFCVAIAAVVACVAIIVLGIFSYARQSTEQYYITANRCIESRGTWVPTLNSTGACIITRNQDQ